MADRTFIDAETALAEHRRAIGMPSSGDFIIKPLAGVVDAIPATLEARAKADFRVFLTLIWRHLLGVDPSPIQLDMAYWLQHGPSRAITMAFRGFSKSWITGAYALWRLYVNPDEKILVVSGSLIRAMATTNWCLQLIMTLPLLKELEAQEQLQAVKPDVRRGELHPGPVRQLHGDGHWGPARRLPWHLHHPGRRGDADQLADGGRQGEEP
jgi:hypothetical protein